MGQNTAKNFNSMLKIFTKIGFRPRIKFYVFTQANAIYEPASDK